MKALVLALLIVVGALSIALLRELAPAEPTGVDHHSAPAAGPAPARAATVAPIVPHDDVRPQIAATIERDLPRIRTATDLVPYLDQLEATARRNHKVSALEVEPGMQAIAAVGGESMVQRQREFGDRMATLSAELDDR